MRCPECNESMIYFSEVQQGLCRFCGPGSAKAMYRGQRHADALSGVPVPGDMRTPSGDTVQLTAAQAMPLERAALLTTEGVQMLPGFGINAPAPAPGTLSPGAEAAMMQAKAGKGYCSRCLVEQAGNKVDDNVIRHDTNCPNAPKNGATNNAPSAQEERG